jgi:hypothetical protein
MSIASLITASALTSLLVLTAPASQAGETQPSQTMKPLQAISFDAGSQRAVGYFLSNSGNCNLVLTLAPTPNWEDEDADVIAFTTTRFEAQIPAGKKTRYNSAEGQAWLFACQSQAASMTMTPVNRLAAGKAK